MVVIVASCTYDTMTVSVRMFVMLMAAIPVLVVMVAVVVMSMRVVCVRAVTTSDQKHR